MKRYYYEAPRRTVLTGTQGTAMQLDSFWEANNSTVTLAPGVLLDLAKAPHVLIAGTTGSGKTVMMHSIICSLLSKNTPSSARLLLIDPKRIEFFCYKDHPMLWKPVITDVEKAEKALSDAVQEMERRFSVMERKEQRIWKGSKLYIFVDELADLLLSVDKKVSKKIETNLIRLVQKGRAAGIHCVLATQNPVVKVFSGIIKANCPTRIALKTKTITESRVILDHKGAEELNGCGDAILSDAYGNEYRFQGGYISDEELEEFTHDYIVKRIRTGLPRLLFGKYAPAVKGAMC